MRIKALAICAALALASLAACTWPEVREANAIAVGCEAVKAESAAVCGYSVYGTFVIAQETAAKIATDVGPGAVRNKIIAAEEAAKPVGDKLYQALVEYETIRVQLAAGSSTQEKLTIALANINTWISRLTPLVGDMLMANAAGVK